MKYEGSKFLGGEQFLDGNEYQGCTFIQCHLIFGATGSVGLHSCTFVECSWSFDGPALGTILFLQAIYQGLGEQGMELVDSIFSSIRHGSVQQPLPAPVDESQPVRTGVPA